MQSNLPSSFASAAAGQNANRDGRNGARADGRGTTSGEWPRNGRSANGTLTFRRPSTTPSNQPLAQSNAADAVQPPETAPAYRRREYTRDQLLAIFESAPPIDVSTLFAQGWNPGQANGSGSQSRGWGKSGDSHVQPQEPELCWDASASTTPSNLREMTTEERELFSSDVNSPVKPPPQNKENNHAGGTLLNGRKTSVTQANSNNFSLASPSSASRPGTRRRETTDTNPFSGGGGLASPTTAVRPGKDDGSSWLSRKNTEVKDAMFEEPEEDAELRDTAPGRNTNVFGGLSRTNTTSSAAPLTTAASLWGQPAVSSPSSSGLGSFGNFALPGASGATDKRPGNSQSRLARLLPNNTDDSTAARTNESPFDSTSNRPWRARQRTDTDPFGGADSGLSGSAVLGGAQDNSPPSTNAEPRRNIYDTPVKGSAGDFGMAGLNIGGHQDQEHESAPLSPSETNPYQSPAGERGENEDAGDRVHGHGLGLGGSDHMSLFSNNLPRAFGQAAFEGSDRSQTSSVGAKAYPSLSNLGGWPTSATPDRERNPFGSNPFGNSLFGGMGDLHSPSLGNLSGVFGPASTTGLTGSGSIGRGSKLPSMFPPAMQSQMQGQDTESLADSLPDHRGNPLGAIGRNAFGEPPRDVDSPVRGARGVFSDFDPPRVSESMTGSISSLPSAQAFPQTSGTPFSGVQPTDPPSAQPRSMVMPDRMRWVYLDPRGIQQGPFTGLEMNDWFKGNYFTADLRVKRLEDSDFEPLGQLIRRIGNSREPFLVPMMGIPYGPPAQSGPFSPSASGVIQPPLVNAFPSFGRTLTANEQNELERRKQEEQFLMAQQRDMLSSQQRTMGRLQMQTHPGLNHHSSAHSLQSQPSFGSISSPITMPPSAIPPIGYLGNSAAFPASHQGQSINHGGNTASSIEDLFREEHLARLSAEERQVLANIQGPGAIGPTQNQQPHGGPSMESFRNRLPGTEELLEDGEGFRERLQEFEKLRVGIDTQSEQAQAAPESKAGEASSVSSPTTCSGDAQLTAKANARQQSQSSREVEPASTSKEFEQAQAAAVAKLSGLPSPFPPPQSSTPLPAPAPQRVKSNLPEQYATSSRSETPDITPSSAAAPPPLAPWAKDTASEAPRGPSLKEIQEAEAKKAAKAEEAASALRRAMAEQEAAKEREKAATIAPGLPTTSTWGTASPVSLGTANSPWAKPAVVKAPAPGLASPAPSADKKKTLADIQREEEVRKAKAREVAAQTGAAAIAGKRYADLASKPNAISGLGQLPATAAGVAASAPAGWATVGAGGKVKIPTGPAAQTRSVSSTNVKSVAAAPPSKPAPKPAAASGTSSRSEAMDEFNKWVQGQLTRGLTGVNDINNFAQTLMVLPPDATIIADAVYSTSKTMNGQHFAAEYIRRKKLAEKGVVEKQAVDTAPQTGNAGGWNEVAKKTAHKEPSGDAALPAGFKVVPGRKKGKK